MKPLSEYDSFIDRKSQLDTAYGFDPVWMPEFLYDFQKAIVDWAVKRGRAAIFADCGLGKTPMQLVWAENIIRYTNKPVLILTPLAVSQQTIREAEKFGIEAERCVDGKIIGGKKIIITNYERLHYFSRDQFSGVVCDESSILKSFNGARKNEITDFMKKLPYRLLCTATAAPNDYIELGTSSEALGELGYMDMLTRFFKNDQNTNNPNRLWDGSGWRLKAHAEQHFWRWICSWARAIRHPSDIGYDDGRFILPKLIENEHIVEVLSLPEGRLFALPAVGLKEQRDERRRSIQERCERVAKIAASTHHPIVCWCHLNNEGDVLEEMITDSKQISGSDCDENKEEKFIAFSSGQLRVLVIKPKIGAWGLNWQHCSHMTFFPSHSYEQYYQGVRRCWRFGQKKPVTVDIVTTEGEQGVKKNLVRKSLAADKMFSELVSHVNDALKIERENFQKIKTEVPSWLS